MRRPDRSGRGTGLTLLADRTGASLLMTWARALSPTALERSPSCARPPSMSSTLCGVAAVRQAAQRHRSGDWSAHCFSCLLRSGIQARREQTASLGLGPWCCSPRSCRCSHVSPSRARCAVSALRPGGLTATLRGAYDNYHRAVAVGQRVVVPASFEHGPAEAIGAAAASTPGARGPAPLAPVGALATAAVPAERPRDKVTDFLDARCAHARVACPMLALLLHAHTAIP